MRNLFQGVSAFPITPADHAGQVDTDALCRLLKPLVHDGVSSIGLLGSTGTYAYLSRQERRRAIMAAADCIADKTPLIVGVGALRTDDARTFACDARDAGADGLLLAPMSYTPLTEEEVYQHFVAVAGATDLPLCIYNNPGTTHFSFGTDLLARLATVENITAVKMPLPADANLATDLHRLRQALPSDFIIGYSGDWGCASALIAGADSWFSVLAGVLPAHAVALTRAAQTGDATAARALDARLTPLWTLFKRHGSLRVVYAAANLTGLTNAEPPRPLLPLDQPVRQELSAILTELGAL
ncbi:dihydrodipicolinate synthase family protein [Yoonia sp.]|uniref:dihydrodipicolinate synthase family protein n=1 Tax=Yoonia sp. TaxID=2212373 RepID=UPI003F6B8C54